MTLCSVPLATVPSVVAVAASKVTSGTEFWPPLQSVGRAPSDGDLADTRRAPNANKPSRQRRDERMAAGEETLRAREERVGGASEGA